jgi:hypothetical protein
MVQILGLQLKLHLGLNRTDIEELTPAYWRMHIDPVLLSDGAATTLLTIQLNLVAGTITGYLSDRPDLSHLLEKILRFDVWSVFIFQLSHPTFTQGTQWPVLPYRSRPWIGRHKSRDYRNCATRWRLCASYTTPWRSKVCLPHPQPNDLVSPVTVFPNIDVCPQLSPVVSPVLASCLQD